MQRATEVDHVTLQTFWQLYTRTHIQTLVHALEKLHYMSKPGAEQHQCFHFIHIKNELHWKSTCTIIYCFSPPMSILYYTKWDKEKNFKTGSRRQLWDICHCLSLVVCLCRDAAVVSNCKNVFFLKRPLVLLDTVQSNALSSLVIIMIH